MQHEKYTERAQNQSHEDHSHISGRNLMAITMPSTRTNAFDPAAHLTKQGWKGKGTGELLCLPSPHSH